MLPNYLFYLILKKKVTKVTFELYPLRRKAFCGNFQGNFLRNFLRESYPCFLKVTLRKLPLE